jgi:ABC-type glycerol-3-phosphate transport system substrate-binding protein
MWKSQVSTEGMGSMKVMKKLCALALILAMLCSMSGCCCCLPSDGMAEDMMDSFEEIIESIEDMMLELDLSGTKTPGDWDPIWGPSDNAEQKPNADSGKLDQEQGATLKIMIPGFNPDDPTTWQYEVFEEFRSQYPKVDLEFVRTTWSDWESKLVATYEAGSHIDVLYNSVNSNPLLPVLGYTQPLRDYVDLENPNLHQITMEACFQFGGEIYVASTETNFGVIYYNKDMFANAGLKDPMETYKRGQWNWNTFAEYANRLTDHKEGVYGFATEYPYLFYGANATSTLEIRDGKYYLNTDDHAFKEALRFISDGWCVSRWQGWEGSAMASFQMNRVAMLGSFSQYELEVNQLSEIYGWDPIDYGVVPLPTGPSNYEGYNMVHSGGYSIGTDSDCPNHAGKLIDMLIDGQAKYRERQEQRLPADSVWLYREMSNRMFCVNTRDSAIGGGKELYDAVCNGYNSEAAIKMIERQYQSVLNQIQGE